MNQPHMLNISIPKNIWEEMCFKETQEKKNHQPESSIGYLSAKTLPTHHSSSMTDSSAAISTYIIRIPCVNITLKIQTSKMKSNDVEA